MLCSSKTCSLRLCSVHGPSTRKPIPPDVSSSSEFFFSIVSAVHLSCLIIVAHSVGEHNDRDRTSSQPCDDFRALVALQCDELHDGYSLVDKFGQGGHVTLSQCPLVWLWSAPPICCIRQDVQWPLSGHPSKNVNVARWQSSYSTRRTSCTHDHLERANHIHTTACF